MSTALESLNSCALILIYSNDKEPKNYYNILAQRNVLIQHVLFLLKQKNRGKKEKVKLKRKEKAREVLGFLNCITCLADFSKLINQNLHYCQVNLY